MSESLVKVIASEPYSEPPMFTGDRCVEVQYACEMVDRLGYPSMLACYLIARVNY